MKRSHPSRSTSAFSLVPGDSPQRGYSEEEILEKAVRVADGRWGVASGFFIAFDSQQPGSLWIASGSPLSARRAAKRILADASLIDQLQKKRKPIFRADPKAPSVLIPLSRKIVPFGVFCLILDRAVWNRADFAAASEIAWQAGMAIQTLRRLREKEQYQKDLEARLEELNLLRQELARKEKMAALGQIVGNVNHELRQPLEVITNAVYYLKMQLNRNEIGPIKKEFERFLTIISDECRSATDLVNELLDFTRKKEVVSIRVDLNQLLESLLQRAPLPETVRIKRRFSRKVPMVFIDPIQVSRALGNFILNGIQAMTQGGTLEVATHLTRTSVEVVIHDSGEGIAPENMRRIFEPLFTTKARGVGLGLPLAKQYIEANHGEIHVESRVGIGTTFHVSFPRLQAA